MWGSDWPVVNLAGDYAAWHDHVRRRLALFDSAMSRQVMGDVARRFYRLTSAEEP
jgi:L-fuconolactonase